MKHTGPKTYRIATVHKHHMTLVPSPLLYRDQAEGYAADMVLGGFDVVVVNTHSE